MSSREEPAGSNDARRARWVATALGVTIALAHAPYARAQDAGGTKVTVASDVGLEGLTFYREGKLAEALASFTAAERIQHSPVFVLFMARCTHQLGDPMAARELYAKVAAETLAADAPDTWRRAKAEAEAELRTLEDRLPKLRIEGASGAPVTDLRVDGVATKAGEPVFVAPGRHEIVGVVDGATTTRTVELAFGSGTTTIELAPATQRVPNYLPGALCLGLGGLSLVAGTITGVSAIGIADDIEERCFGNRCDPDDEPRAGTATALGVVSTVSFIVGGALAVAGTILVITPPESEVRVEVGAGSLRLGGRF